MAFLVTLPPAAFVITELLASKLSAKVGMHRYNTANRGTQTSQPWAVIDQQTLFCLQSTSRLQTCGPSHKRISELYLAYFYDQYFFKEECILFYEVTHILSCVPVV